MSLNPDDQPSTSKVATESRSVSRMSGDQASTSQEDTESRATNRMSGASLEAENYFLKQVEELTKKLNDLTVRFSYEQIKQNEALYTGLPTHSLFMVLFETMDKFSLNYYAKWHVKMLPKIDQLLMTLMKLRLNVPHDDLALRFRCSTAIVTNVVMT